VNISACENKLFCLFWPEMKSKFLRYSLGFLLVLLYSVIKPEAQESQAEFVPVVQNDPPFLSIDQSWVDSVMETLSLEERIAQMIMVYGYSNMGPEHQKAVLRQVRKQKVGGILFFQGEALEQARLTNIYQKASQVPLLIAIDGENGLGMRLDNTLSYPATMILGAISDNSLIYRLGRDMGRQFRRLGVQMNLAPVADINNRQNNPVIGSRSFGEGRKNVADKVIAYMEGMQDQGVLVSAKHFPGHGDTDTDSHRALPVIPLEKRRLDSL
jgi:beta-glucosidase-like glycosyl hydrolase